jgi:alpha/beta superfamily hydrolase
MKSVYTFLTVLIFLQVSFSQDVVGNWTGELNFQGNSLDLNFQVYKNENGYKSSLSVPAQSLSDFKSTSTSFVDSLLSIELKPLGIRYQGKWSTTDTIVGNFVQNGLSLKLNLIRGNTKLNRPQEPMPPYDYYEEEIKFRNETDSIHLSGTLTLPDKKGSYPAVILISGSGPQDRNSYIMGHKPFLLLAHELTQSGVAVLRFDERGVGQSEGEFQEASLDDLIADVKSAFDYLKKRPEVDSKKIGLLGHSLGGILAPRLATKEEISFLVLLAAPGIDGNKMMLKQRADFLKLRGLNDTQVEKSNEMLSTTYDFILSTEAEGQQMKDELSVFFADNYADVMMEKELMAMAEQLSSRELLGILRNKPSTYLSLVNCPVLAIGGSKDFQVSSKENLEAIELELKKGGNQQVEIKEFEGLNHLLQESETGDISEYGVIEQTMSPEVLEHVKEWIKRQVN